MGNGDPLWAPYAPGWVLMYWRTEALSPHLGSKNLCFPLESQPCQVLWLRESAALGLWSRVCRRRWGFRTQ